MRTRGTATTPRQKKTFLEQYRTSKKIGFWGPTYKKKYYAGLLYLFDVPTILSSLTNITPTNASPSLGQVASRPNITIQAKN